MNNFIPISRSLFNHYLWKEKRKLSKFEAWLDILQMVSYIDNNSQMINGILCKWKRGQYPVSISFLCTRWKWSEKPLRNYLKLLEKDKMIILKRSSKWTMLTVCNYDTYNFKGQTDDNQGSIKGQQLNKDNKEVIKKQFSSWAIDMKLDVNKVLDQLDKAWMYYEDLGWKNKNGKPVTNVASTIRSNWFKDLEGYKPQDNIYIDRSPVN